MKKTYFYTYLLIVLNLLIVDLSAQTATTSSSGAPCTMVFNNTYNTGYCYDYYDSAPGSGYTYYYSGATTNSATSCLDGENTYPSIDIQHAIWYYTNGLTPTATYAWDIIYYVNNGSYYHTGHYWYTNSSGAQDLITYECIQNAGHSNITNRVWT